MVGMSRRVRLCGELRSVPPRGKGLGSELAIGGSGDQGGWCERVGYGSVGRKEPLGRTRRSEALHLPLPQPDRDVGAFHPIILALGPDVVGAETELAGGRMMAFARFGEQ